MNRPRIQPTASPEQADPSLSPSSSVSKAVRNRTDLLLSPPRLPSDFFDHLRAKPMLDTDGYDLQKACLLMCSNLDVILARMSQIEALPKNAQMTREALEERLQPDLYAQISETLQSFSELSHPLMSKCTHPSKGTDYLTNTNRGPGTLADDLEVLLEHLQTMRPLDSSLRKLGLVDYIRQREEAVQIRMDQCDNTQFVVRYWMQRHQEVRISHMLDQEAQNEYLTELIMRATSGQMNMGYNVVGQHGMPLTVHFMENDLGNNEAERQMILLSIFWQMMGAIEGFHFVRRFYKPAG